MKQIDALVVGAGMAGLTAASYLSRAGRNVLICERTDKPGGLVTDFRIGEFHFDAGIRAMENSGIVRPMLRELGIEVQFLKNPVTIRISDGTVRVDRDGLEGYEALLLRFFPESTGDIRAITHQIRRVMRIMDVLYGIDNPLFLDVRRDPTYLLHTILPWLIRYQMQMRKVSRLQQPVNQYLADMSVNRSLNDMVAQHFFRNTPAFFALSYFGLYRDYIYPKGGTGALPQAMEDYVLSHGGAIEYRAEITRLDPHSRVAKTGDGRVFSYRSLIWAADMSALYRVIGGNAPAVQPYRTQAARVLQGHGGDSVLTAFYALDLNPQRIEDAFGAHCFFTPSTAGLSSLGLDSWMQCIVDKSPDERRLALEKWLARYLALTTYEISCPAVRDASLAPVGQSGLIVSTIFDVALTRCVKRDGWYPEFKELCSKQILAQLDRALPGIGAQALNASCATPLTIERETGNLDGAITGWAFGGVMPAEARFKKIARAIRTPIPHTYQAGQWTFSPSGLPVSILTGKLAADAALRDLGGKQI